MEVKNKEITDRIEAEMAKAPWRMDMNMPGSRVGADFEAVIMGFKVRKCGQLYSDQSLFYTNRQGEEWESYFMKRVSVAYDIGTDIHTFENFIMQECEFVDHVRKLIAAEKEAAIISEACEKFGGIEIDAIFFDEMPATRNRL